MDGEENERGAVNEEEEDEEDEDKDEDEDEEEGKNLTRANNNNNQTRQIIREKKRNNECARRTRRLIEKHQHLLVKCPFLLLSPFSHLKYSMDVISSLPCSPSTTCRKLSLCMCVYTPLTDQTPKLNASALTSSMASG